MASRSILLRVAAFALLTCLPACAANAQQDYKDARAKLDPVLGQITLPLEAYAMTSSEEQEVAHANALLLDECLAKGGRDFPRASQDWESIPNLPDRRYGVWSNADAKSNGYEFPAPPGSAELTAQEDALSESWWSAYQACQSDLNLFQPLRPNGSSQNSPVDQGMRESFEALKASVEFASALKEWTSCVTSKGLTPNPADNAMVPAFPPAGEEQLRVAAIDVECKESLNSVQPLADFEARHQMAFIARHESELTEHRAQVDKVLAEAREVLATRGG